MVWSYATLGMEDMVLFGRVAELATPRLMEFKPVELTNAMWALAKGKTDSPIFFEAAALVVSLSTVSQEVVALAVLWVMVSSTSGWTPTLPSAASSRGLPRAVPPSISWQEQA